jgi:hypothetical protein
MYNPQGNGDKQWKIEEDFIDKTAHKQMTPLSLSKTQLVMGMVQVKLDNIPVHLCTIAIHLSTGDFSKLVLKNQFLMASDR